MEDIVDTLKRAEEACVIAAGRLCMETTDLSDYKLRSFKEVCQGGCK